VHSSRLSAEACAADLLALRAEQAIERIAEYIRDLRAQSETQWVVVGLSGGIDSALLAALAVRALGKDAVRSLYLPDRHSDRAYARSARAVADALGITLQTINIEPFLRNRGIYSSWFLRFASVSARLNRVVLQCQRRARGEKSVLLPGRHADRKRARAGRGGLAHLGERHKQRRVLLEQKAQSERSQLIGAGNRTESLIGFFLPGGADDLPIQPLTGLYKTQVRQLARYLALPERLLAQPPSPDLVRGITDELMIGLPYAKVDLALDHLEGGVTAEQLAAAGVSPDDVRQVGAMNSAALGKHTAEMEPPPVDGGPDGGYRRVGGAAQPGAQSSADT